MLQAESRRLKRKLLNRLREDDLDQEVGLLALDASSNEMPHRTCDFKFKRRSCARGEPSMLDKFEVTSSRGGDAEEDDCFSEVLLNEPEGGKPSSTFPSQCPIRVDFGAGLISAEDEDGYSTADYSYGSIDETDDRQLLVEDDFDSSELSAVGSNVALSKELSHWALKHNITHAAIDDLLCILKARGNSELPLTANTLLKTPRNTTHRVSVLGSGKYWYRGIFKCLCPQLPVLLARTTLEENLVDIDIFIVGISPHKHPSVSLHNVAPCG